jgi:hypothetical protein
VIPGSHAALSAAPDEEDQVARLERFSAAHPDVIILLLGACPTAWADGQRIQRPTLRGLLGSLEETFQADPQASQAGGSQ